MANIVLGKPLRILPKTQLLQPVSDLLHCGSGPPAPETLSEKPAIQ